MWTFKDTQSFIKQKTTWEIIEENFYRFCKPKQNEIVA